MELVKLSYPPEIILDYAKKIAADAKKTEDMPKAQILMMDDIVKLVEIATKAMTPAKPETIKQNN